MRQRAGTCNTTSGRQMNKGKCVGSLSCLPSMHGNGGLCQIRSSSSSCRWPAAKPPLPKSPGRKPISARRGSLPCGLALSRVRCDPHCERRFGANQDGLVPIRGSGSAGRSRKPANLLQVLNTYTGRPQSRHTRNHPKYRLRARPPTRQLVEQIHPPQGPILPHKGA